MGTSDKALPGQENIAKTKFQEIAFAYAILSDDRRRKRYDTTGNTAESLDIDDDDDFNWMDFFRAQWAETVTSEKISNFQGRYQGSEEEKRDILTSYTRFKGDLNKIFGEVMLSNPLNDEDRFRDLITGAIETGKVVAYEAFTNESESRRRARQNKATKEAQQAEKHAEDLGLKGGGKEGSASGKKDGEAALMEMIQQRQKGRAATFLDDLEAKYAAPKKGKGAAAAANGGKNKTKNKKKESSEPPEEAFEKMGARSRKSQKKQVINDDDDEEDDDEEDVQEEKEYEEDEDDSADDDDFISEDDEDGEDVRPKKKQKTAKSAATTNGRKPSRRKQRR